MTAKHTQGPWLRDGTTVYALTQEGWRRGEPCMVNRFTISVMAGRYSTPEELEAVAQVTQAAPDGYSFARNVESMIIDGGLADDPAWSPILAECRAYLAKAEGRQP